VYSHARAPEDQYYCKLRNPASMGFFGFGAGTTVTVTIRFTVSGWATWIRDSSSYMRTNAGLKSPFSKHAKKVKFYPTVRTMTVKRA
jgi:hypothetical protein